MTYFLNFRGGSIGGPVVDPYLLMGDGTTSPPSVAPVEWPLVPSVVAGKDILFVAHGFNVPYAYGACSLGRLEQYLNLADPGLFIGVLWPGDAWIPVVDYPFEGDVATQCGRKLADFCNTQCRQAASLSFASHSLGGRLILEAIAGLETDAEVACIAAGAINNDCLDTEYSGSTKQANRIYALASENDRVLKYAFAIGDPFADLLHDDHTPFELAFGTRGPAVPIPDKVQRPWQITQQVYDHGDYLPSGNIPAPPPPAPPDVEKWTRVADFMKRAFLGQTETWPGG